ncbi:hypothetical protein LPN01_18340 [Sphingomonas sp. A2-49]|uniref:hypothetical protein n=1 Tax=Sphingomonas sp. A2-49 TaxID=1391375 RepID=UPI0021D398F4|nr:hypothetical protein [Sphingomonas sp. A2-49]MCU6456041.1 hypothetical protein [Sphingomonas sp. A2-49]
MTDFDRQLMPKAVVCGFGAGLRLCPKPCRSDRRYRNMNGRPKLRSLKELLSV